MRSAELDLLHVATHRAEEARAAFGWLRDHAPVHWQEGQPGFWSLTRHADVLAALRDRRHFGSEAGNMLDSLLGDHDPAAGRMLVVSDGEYHEQLRRAMLRELGPQALAPVAESVRGATDELLGAFVARGGGDFVADVAAQVPLYAICELLGVPVSDRQEMLKLTRDALLSEDPGGDLLGARLARMEILGYYQSLAAERRTAPGSDIVSLLVSTRVTGRPLTDEEVLLNCYNLIIGGDETTRLSLSGGLLALLEHPDQWAALVASPDLVDTGVEEILRWTTPASHVARTVTAPVHIGGVDLEVGDVVALWVLSANPPAALDGLLQPLLLQRRPARGLLGVPGWGGHRRFRTRPGHLESASACGWRGSRASCQRTADLGPERDADGRVRPRGAGWQPGGAPG